MIDPVRPEVRDAVAHCKGAGIRVVLITGDADHEMLARKIKALKKQVILVTWDLGQKTSTAPALRDEVTLHIDLKQRTAENPGLKEHICSSTSVR